MCRSRYTDAQSESFPYTSIDDEDADTASCAMYFAWAGIVTSQVLSSTVLLLFMLLEEANEGNIDTEPWTSIMTIGTVLNVGVLIHVFSWAKKYRWFMLVFAMIQTLLVLWEYTPMTHSVSNIGCGFALVGIMVHRKNRRNADVVNTDDANDR